MSGLASSIRHMGGSYLVPRGMCAVVVYYPAIGHVFLVYSCRKQKSRQSALAAFMLNSQIENECVGLHVLHHIILAHLAKWIPQGLSNTFHLHNMNSMKLVIPLHSLYWSIHTKDESNCRSAFAFIFGVNWLWRCGVTASFGVFFHEMKCNGVTSFMEFMTG